MKKTTKILWILLVFLSACSLFAGCSGTPKTAGEVRKALEENDIRVDVSFYTDEPAPDRLLIAKGKKIIQGSFRDGGVARLVYYDAAVTRFYIPFSRSEKDQQERSELEKLSDQEYTQAQKELEKSLVAFLREMNLTQADLLTFTDWIAENATKEQPLPAEE